MDAGFGKAKVRDLGPVPFITKERQYPLIARLT
jgi:hypothetical protein